MLRTNSLHLSQVIRRISEADHFNNLQTLKIARSIDLYSAAERDNCFVSNNCKFFIILSVLSDSNLEIQYFKHKSDVNSYPCSSGLLRIYLVHGLSDPQTILKSKELLSQKCMLLPINTEKFFCIPICNSIN